jgi:DNA-binding response OmpR family regulator
MNQEAFMEAVPQILSVEDDPQLFELIRLSLKSLPIRLFHAPTGQDAIDLLQQTVIDLIILDIMLPDMHGWAVLKEVEAQNISVQGVIVLTAQTAATHRVIARLQNISIYMNKPFLPQDLRAKVAETLGIPDVKTDVL